MTGELVAGGGLLLLYAVVAMALAPPLVTRRRWTSRLPRTALIVWVVALGSGAVAILASLGCVVSAASVLPREPHHELTLHHVLNGIGITVAAWLMTAIGGGAVCATLYRAVVGAASRRRLRSTVALVMPRGERAGRRTPAFVVDSQGVGAISLPGRHPVIMVSSALRDTLTSAQLDAVVEHERGHLVQRHHLLLQLADLQYRCAPLLPCARALERSVHLLVEFAADDHAAHHCGDATTAMALRRLGAATGDQALVLRARRLERRGCRGGRALPIRHHRPERSTCS